MRTVDRQGVHIEQCENCRGIFLDHGELEHMLSAEDRFYGASHDAVPGGHRGKPDSPRPYRGGGHSDSPRPCRGERHADSPGPYQNRKNRSSLGFLFGERRTRSSPGEDPDMLARSWRCTSMRSERATTTPAG
jgi:Zn-finger nucleic acid-binding protein